MVVKDTVITRLPLPPALPDNDRPIWEIIMELSAELSDDEWREQPTDGALNYRHYLYGQPKRDYHETGPEHISKDEAA